MHTGIIWCPAETHHQRHLGVVISKNVTAVIIIKGQTCNCAAWKWCHRKKKKKCMCKCMPQSLRGWHKLNNHLQSVARLCFVDTGEGFSVWLEGDTVWFSFCFASRTLIPAGQLQLGVLSPFIVSDFHSSKGCRPEAERWRGREGERRINIWRNPPSLVVSILWLKINKLEVTSCL